MFWIIKITYIFIEVPLELGIRTQIFFLIILFSCIMNSKLELKLNSLVLDYN